MAMASIGQASLERLQTRHHGEVILPGDARYDKARQAWNLTVDQHPALILVAESPSDIVEAVRLARAEGLGIAIMATGHGVSRPADNALLIVTSQLRDIQVDSTRQTAWVGAGAKWGMVLEKTQAHGLAPLLGSSPDVGAVGYTLGGGMGWLARKYGMSVDSVLAFEVVTADGQIVQASETENSDLFWGLRGGGGNFGVVTGMEIQLYPVSTVYGGNLIYPADMAREVFLRYRDWLPSVPEELTSSVALTNFPPLPIVPEFLRGRSVVIVRGCYCGPVEQGAALLQGWRDWQAPFVDDFKVMPFSEVGMISNEPIDPVPAQSSGAWLRDLNDEAIDILIRYGIAVNGPSPVLITETRHAGGMIARVDKYANAYGNRSAAHTLQLVGMTPTPEAVQSFEQYTGELKRALEPHLTGNVYINFLEGEEARQRTQDAYLPETYRRLMALKAQYDPDNLFCHSFDIPPMAEG